MSVIGDNMSTVVFSTLTTGGVPSGNVAYLIGKDVSFSFRSGHQTISLVYGDAVKLNMGKVSTTVSIRGIIPISNLNLVCAYLDQSLRKHTNGNGGIKYNLWIRINNSDNYYKFWYDEGYKDYLLVWVDSYDFNLTHDSNVVEMSIVCSYAGKMIN